MRSPPDAPWPGAPDAPVLTRHALDRMLERGVSLADVRSVLAAPFVVRKSKRSGLVRAVGPGLRGARRAWLVVVVASATGVIVTVFWRSPREAAAHCATAKPAQRRHAEVSHDAA